MMFGYGDGGPGGWLWMLGGLVLMVGIVLLVVWAMGGGARGTRPDEGRPTPLEILCERYARGEITEEQFEQSRQILERR